MRYNEIFGLRFFDVVEKKEPEIAVREMGGGSYSDEMLQKNDRGKRENCDANILNSAHGTTIGTTMERPWRQNSPPSGDALSASNHEPKLFFLLAPSLPYVVQRAENNGDTGLKYIMVGQEYIAAEKFRPNCPVVAVSSEAHLDANDIAVAVELFVLCAGRSRR